MTDLPLIFATVGTDVHPFDRMADWIDAWLALDGGTRARCVMQTGTSKTPKRAEHSPYLGYADMESLVQDARVVVCHAGRNARQGADRHASLVGARRAR